ncbi:AraC-like ligand-binding domain-containing protein [Saccharopolyspora mangrovi]|uniref:Helix-turn-helix domain-containing protein n=1 Tax=Saccharopolyspora mangrovi TaxID=3082379 RepID=A0ABU6AK49_9PSEU|nr:helix-turn-helix domain-containing protein [Saccharopolyspora sp. S2-29]MEB3371947.1 helix-turn-helix domain-containing protein [Saccharopolyspora sp. S2-29]
MMSVSSDEEVGEFEASASTVFAPLRIRPLRPGPFRSSLRATSAGEVAVTRIRCAPCQVRRTPRLIGSGDRDLVKVTMLTEGRGEVEQDGRRCVLTPGDLVNYDTDRPYQLNFPAPYDITVVAVPKWLLGGHVDTLATRSAIAVPTSRGVQRVVGGFFRTMTDVLGEDTGGFSGDAGRHLTDALVSMVISELAELRPEPGEDLADRVLAHCLARLDDPGLTVESVARAHHVSVRQLHKLFAERPMTLSAWIRRQRLQRIRRDLADPALADRTAAAIAARWGVLDATHLSRALKAEFGLTAMEIRREAR